MLSLNLDPSVVGRRRTLALVADLGFSEDDFEALRTSLGGDDDTLFVEAPVDTNVPGSRAVMTVISPGHLHLHVFEALPAEHVEDEQEQEEEEDVSEEPPVIHQVDSQLLLAAATATANRSRLQIRCSARAEFVREQHRPLLSLPLHLWAPGSFVLGPMVGGRFRYPALNKSWVALDSADDESRFTVHLEFSRHGSLTVQSFERLWSLAFSHVKKVVVESPDDSPSDSEVN